MGGGGELIRTAFLSPSGRRPLRAREREREREMVFGMVTFITITTTALPARCKAGVQNTGFTHPSLFLCSSQEAAWLAENARVKAETRERERREEGGEKEGEMEGEREREKILPQMDLGEM